MIVLVEISIGWRSDQYIIQNGNLREKKFRKENETFASRISELLGITNWRPEVWLYAEVICDIFISMDDKVQRQKGRLVGDWILEQVIERLEALTCLFIGLLRDLLMLL